MKNHKPVTTALTLLLLFTAAGAPAQTVSLDTALSGAADELSRNVDRGSAVAVLSMRSDFPRMAAYIIDEITSSLVNQRRYTVVDRSQLDIIRQEEQFQLSGEVSDESARAIGKKLGAQLIIIGSFEPVGNYHRLMLQMIEVETAAILETYSANIRNDQLVMSLLGNGEVLAEMPVYSDFTNGQRWGTGALNMFIPGLGSYIIMRDIAGGSIHVGLIAIGGIFAYWGATDAHFTVNSQKYSMKLPGLIAGSAFLLGGTVFNITRSAFYHKPRPQTASFIAPESWNIAVLPGSLVWTLRYK
ncbi:MAG: penicillin-binding protein activator LpoB [Treponema sp.]|jgi:TolB-like protein|nr:penicillin-binding protein activator LpoB [Treponema sp.]